MFRHVPAHEGVYFLEGQQPEGYRISTYVLEGGYWLIHVPPAEEIRV